MFELLFPGENGRKRKKFFSEKGPKMNFSANLSNIANSSPAGLKCTFQWPKVTPYKGLKHILTEESELFK